MGHKHLLHQVLQCSVQSQPVNFLGTMLYSTVTLVSVLHALDTASCAGGEDPCHVLDGLRNMAVLCWLLDYSRC